jgi:hypothetical protein
VEVPYEIRGEIQSLSVSTGRFAALATNRLNLSTYADAKKGAQDGPVIVPNDSANSKLLQIQSQCGHPSQLSAEELAIVKAWIDAGAPEK